MPPLPPAPPRPANFARPVQAPLPAVDPAVGLRLPLPLTAEVAAAVAEGRIPSNPLPRLLLLLLLLLSLFLVSLPVLVLPAPMPPPSLLPAAPSRLTLILPPTTTLGLLPTGDEDKPP
ncbi:unnamed protein product, partial [Ectocarpus sp. 8 AP-2014]